VLLCVDDPWDLGLRALHGLFDGCQPTVRCMGVSTVTLSFTEGGDGDFYVEGPVPVSTLPPVGVHDLG